MSEPTTEAGRRHWAEHWNSPDELASILAVEAEARADALDVDLPVLTDAALATAIADVMRENGYNGSMDGPTKMAAAILDRIERRPARADALDVEAFDWRICRLHGRAQDDPAHEYRYPDCENAGYVAAVRADGLDVEALAEAWHMAVAHKPGCGGDIHAQGIRVHRADATDIARTYRAILAERQP